jgi:ribosomal protein S18 acetylase RimI-like enzyme
MSLPFDLPAAADENLAVHATAVTARLAGAHVCVESDLVLADSGLACDTFNFVCRARLARSAAARRVAEAVGHFRTAGRPFSWWLGPGYSPASLPQVLRDQDLVEAESEVAMALDLTALPSSPPDVEGLTISRVRTQDDLHAYAALTAANWDPPDPHVVRYYTLAAAVLLHASAPQWLYLGRVQGEAVATADATFGGGVVGLYNVATHPAFRRRGIGLAMTCAPLIEARTAGWSMAVLHAAAAGVSVYERAGFRPFGTVTEFKPDAPSWGSARPSA